MWHKEEKKLKSNQQQLQVRVLVGNLCEFSFSADRWIDEFHNDLKKIKRRNNYNTEYGYKAFKIDEKTIEVYKMKANLDKDYLMYILRKGENKPSPFDFIK